MTTFSDSAKAYSNNTNTRERSTRHGSLKRWVGQIFLLDQKETTFWKRNITAKKERQPLKICQTFPRHRLSLKYFTPYVVRTLQILKHMFVVQRYSYKGEYQKSQPAVQSYFGRAKAACLCSYCCNRHLWCYDGETFASKKKTRELQATESQDSIISLDLKWSLMLSKTAVLLIWTFDDTNKK